jgi:hypothetical protein
MPHDGTSGIGEWPPFGSADGELGGAWGTTTDDAGSAGRPTRLSAYDPRMARIMPLVALGYGKFVRADRIYALVPLEGPDRGDGRRTLVHVEGIEEPLIASRSEGAIARDVAIAFGQHSPRGRHGEAGAQAPGQEPLFYA